MSPEAQLAIVILAALVVSLLNTVEMIRLIRHINATFLEVETKFNQHINHHMAAVKRQVLEILSDRQVLEILSEQDRNDLPSPVGDGD